VLLLGQNEELSTLETLFPSLRSQKCIKGFVVGRSIWGNSADKWFTGNFSDEQVIAEVFSKYMKLINAWKQTVIHSGSFQ